MSDKSERLAELRAKHGRPPAAPHEPKHDAPTAREAQPRFRGLESGHRACQGCGEALAARLVMECAGPDVMVANATGCLEVFTTAWPQSAWRVPWMHSLFENAPAIASGMEAAMKAKGKNTKVLAFGGDGATYDIGFQALSGMLERYHNILYVCYDNEAYMNTGIQRSSSTPHSATTTTSPAGKERMGKRHLKKDLLSIIAAHHIPYAAAASVAYPQDLQRKVRYAMGIEGPTFLVIHSPCPLGWKHDSAATIEVARRAVECGLFPLVELERGAVTNVMPIRDARPVTDYLELQGRFAHLFNGEDPRAQEERDHLQALADHNIQTFGLNGEGDDPLDTSGIAAVGRGGPVTGRG
ncbi:thiamine pyrophosphate-dependent enzyme [Aliiroseovarius subalbicans]|uniref:thiamine pyrophosphate-dependent enzyme n=1 Tax=Aliiroseovarius subalbicans TaxID=2925840 RepID=UPI001F58B274|nr:thiamine pyrophosphate-dependent enzyme [Aliiroseovarius subalbicans]MCI2399662.1 thiamine pyrophosphate-dependent enzyme [Aliiroseovarius subalbicans]